MQSPKIKNLFLKITLKISLKEADLGSSMTSFPFFILQLHIITNHNVFAINHRFSRYETPIAKNNPPIAKSIKHRFSR